MIGPYNLKGPVQIQLEQIFQNYISTNQSPEHYKKVAETFNKISKLRQKIYQFSQKSPSQIEIQQLEQIEADSLEYLRYLNFLSTKFNFEVYENSNIQINFLWSDSFNHNRQLGAQSIKYEIASVHYNLVIVNYILGSKLILNNNAQDRVKAIMSFRYGLYHIAEIKKCLPNITQFLTQVLILDFQMLNIDILENILVGLSYSVLYDNFLPNISTFGFEKMAILATESSRNFRFGLVIVNQVLNDKVNPFPQEFLYQMKCIILYNFVNMFSKGCQLLANHHESLIEQQPNGNHMGFAIAYTKKGIDTIQSCQKNEKMMKIMHQNYKQNLAVILEELVKQLQVFEFRNQQIYKNQVPEQLQDTQSPPDNIQVKPKQPELLATPISEVNLFNDFLSVEFRQIVQQTKNQVQQMKQKNEQQLNNFCSQKAHQMSENCIQYFLDMKVKQTERQIPPEVKQKILQFKQKGGCEQMKNLIISLKKQNTNCQQMLTSAQNKLQNEAQEDENMRNQFGPSWKRPSSQETAAEYFIEILNLEEQGKIAQQSNQQLENKFNANTKSLELSLLPESEILKLLPQSSDQQFQQSNQNDIDNLKKMNQEIMTKVDDLRADIDTMEIILQTTEFSQIIQTLKNKGLNREQISQELVQQFVQLQKTFDQNILQIQEKLKQFLQCGKNLQQRQQKGNVDPLIKTSQEFLSGLNQVEQLQNEIAQGLQFYTNYSQKIISLEKNVADYILAREMEKDNLTKQIQNEQGKMNFSKVGQFNQIPLQDEPFYKDGQFQMGQSYIYNPYGSKVMLESQVINKDQNNDKK